MTFLLAMILSSSISTAIRCRKSPISWKMSITCQNIQIHYHNNFISHLEQAGMGHRTCPPLARPPAYNQQMTGEGKCAQSESKGGQPPPRLLEGAWRVAKQQQEILLRVSSGTFSADKLVRLLSNALKVVRCFALASDPRAVERLSAEVGQLRRLLRVDRLCMVVRDYHGVRQEMSGTDWFMAFFRALLLWEDCSDLLAYLVQLGAVRGRRALPGLRRRVADCYFLECVGWLALHSFQLARERKDRRKKTVIVLRYLLDTITSHNDFSRRRGALDVRVTAVLGLLSSVLNLWLAWQ